VKKSFGPMIADHDLVKKSFGAMLSWWKQNKSIFRVYKCTT
jgi:hypothetical protein